ncbi:MAG: hypothetical protein HC804_04410 [Anaerolineae bacterium]|nr:hypothetical protein [Anaerolineae bacterium]
MDQLETVTDAIRQEMELMNAARNQAYEQSRQLISICARAIRAIHREEWEKAESLISGKHKQPRTA